jgi:hypothetical protein
MAHPALLRATHTCKTLVRERHNGLEASETLIMPCGGENLQHLLLFVSSGSRKDMLAIIEFAVVLSALPSRYTSKLMICYFRVGTFPFPLPRFRPAPLP